MSHETQKAVASKQAAPTKSVDPDTEAEHDPKRAQSVSNSALRQFGAKSAKSLDDEDVEQRTIVTGFRSAQHALEAAGKSPAEIGAACDVALVHLQHVSHAAAKFSGDDGDAATIEAANAFAAALDRVEKAAPDAVPLRLRFMNQVVRNGLGLDARAPAGSSTKAELGADKSYVVNAIGPAVQLIALRAQSGYQMLESSPAQAPNRDAQVAALADELRASSKYVSSLLGQLSYQERQVFVADVEMAGREVQKLVRWIRTRTPHKGMEDSFGPAMSSFDVVLLSVGLPSIGRTDAAALSEHAVDTGQEEKGAVGTAKENLKTAFRQLAAAQQSAVQQFEELAKLDDVKAPPLVETILKAVAMATLGYFAGELIKVLTTVKAAIAAAPAVMVSDQMRMLVTVGVTASNTAFQATWASAAKDHSVSLARIVFAGVIREDIAAKTTAYEEHIEQLVGESSVSAPQLDAMKDGVRDSREIVQQQYVQHLAHNWASYLARANLGRRPDGTANTREYLGKEAPGGREFGTSKEGTPGVLQMLMVIEKAGSAPRQDPDATKIEGLNMQLARNVFENAGGDFHNVRTPKEIHVHAEFGRAVIILDEHNRFVDAHNWDQVTQDAGMSAYRFWKTYGDRMKLT